jgi:hypothetical protein
MIEIIIVIREAVDHPGKCWTEKSMLQSVDIPATPSEKFTADNIWAAVGKLDEAASGN